MYSSEIKQLREQQANLHEQAKKYTDEIGDKTSEAESRELGEKFDQHMAAWDQIDEQIRRLEKLEAIEARQDQPADDRRPGKGDLRREEPQDVEDRSEEWSEDHAFRTYLAHGFQAIPAEQRHLLKRASLNGERRDLTTGTTSNDAGYTIPQEFFREMEKAMKMHGPMFDGGIVRELNTESGATLKWPTVDDTANASSIHTEGSSVGSASNPTFNEKQFDSYVYKSGVIKLSLELLQDSFTDMDSVVGGLLGERLGRGANAVLTTGTGSSQPQGLVTAITNNTTAAGAAAITFDEIVDVIHDIDPAYRSGGNLRFMFTDLTLAALRKLKNSDGDYLWSGGNVQSGEPATIWGYPYVINQDMAEIATGNISVAFGDFSKFVVRKVAGVNIIRMGERYADELNVGLQAWHRFDSEVIQAGAFSKLTQA